MTSSLHAARRVAPVSPLLSVILAARDPEAAQFDACVASIAALRHSQRLQLVIVVSGHLPAISEACQTRLHSIDIVEQEPGGVYHAYNRGLDEVRAPYVMVMGCDDLLLPGLDPVLDSIDDSIDDSVDHPFERRPHLVAACVLAQGYGIARPTRFRWGLIFRVWCQPGATLPVRRFCCQALRLPLPGAGRSQVQYGISFQSPNGGRLSGRCHLSLFIRRIVIDVS
jgi:glycosyltransferase involved in cell wall biosynthesis